MDRHIMGVLTAVVRSGKDISVNDWRYKLYVHLLCDFFPLRVFMLRLSGWIRRLIKKT